MFFVASKVFWLLAQPLSVVFLLVLAGLIALLVGRRRLAATGLVLALLVHGLVSFTSLGFLLIQPLEARFSVPDEPPERVGAIIMLGGATLARVSTVRQVAELNAAGDRLVTTLWLAQRYPEAPVVLSGGTGLLSGKTESEATTAERLLVAHGIARDRLRLEGQSRNTDENAALTRDLLAEVDGPVVLVTSAFHMPRSVALFEEQGIPVVPWPTDYRSSGNEGFGIDIANPVHNLDVASIAIKEWIGLVAYHWTGRTSELLPAQASNSPAGTSSR